MSKVIIQKKFISHGKLKEMENYMALIDAEIQTNLELIEDYKKTDSSPQTRKEIISLEKSNFNLKNEAEKRGDYLEKYKSKVEYDKAKYLALEKEISENWDKVENQVQGLIDNTGTDESLARFLKSHLETIKDGKYRDIQLDAYEGLKKQLIALVR